MQSYDGKLFFGVTADAHVAPDGRRLRDYILVCFRELCRAAGIKRARPRTAAERAATPTAAKPRAVRRRNPVKPVQPPAGPGPVNGTSLAASSDGAPSAKGNGQTRALEQASLETEPEVVLV